MLSSNLQPPIRVSQSESWERQSGWVIEVCSRVRPRAFMIETVHSISREEQMSQSAVKRLYLMQVGSMPDYQIPIVCALVQTEDGNNILIDSGLPSPIPEEASDFENGQDVIEQLASIGLTPDDIDTVISTHYDIDHAGRHAAFTKAQYVVQRAHHEDAASNPRFAALRPQWDQPMERIRLVDGDTRTAARAGAD